VEPASTVFCLATGRVFNFRGELTMQKLACIVVGAAISLATPIAFAGNYVSGGGFFPAYASDQPYIYHGAGYVYNADSANTRNVIASLGAVNTGGSITYHVYGSGNGLTLSCYVYAWDINNSHSTYSAGNTTTASGNFDFFITVNTPSGGYAATVWCQLPRTNPSAASIYYATGP
jgi:hypothetical protein